MSRLHERLERLVSQESGEPFEEGILYSEDSTLDEVRATEGLVSQLETLGTIVNTTNDQASLENYAWFLKTLTHNANLPLPKRFSLEDYCDRNGLDMVIDRHVQHLRSGITFALEAYIGGFAKRADGYVTTFNKVNKDLESRVGKLNSRKRIAKSNSKSLYTILTIQNDIITSPDVAGDEYSLLSEVIDDVEQVTARLIKEIESGELSKSNNLKYKKLFLLNNTTFTINSEGAKSDTSVLDIPDKYNFMHKVNIERTLGWLAIISSVFKIGLMVKGMASGGGGGRTKTKVSDYMSKDDKRMLQSFLEDVVGFKDLVNRLDDNLDDLARALDECDVDIRTEANRQASAIVEASTVILKHLTEVTHGLDKIISGFT